MEDRLQRPVESRLRSLICNKRPWNQVCREVLCETVQRKEASDITKNFLKTISNIQSVETIKVFTTKPYNLSSKSSERLLNDALKF